MCIRNAKRLGMTLWAYDQVGYGYYGWLEKAAAKTQDSKTHKILFLSSDSASGETVSIKHS